MKFFVLFFLCAAPSALCAAYPQPEALYNEALVFYGQGDRGQAARSLKRALLLKPSFGEARSFYNTIQTEAGGIALAEDKGILFLLTAFNLFPPQIDAAIAALFFLMGSTAMASIFLGRGLASKEVPNRGFPNKSRSRIWLPALLFGFSLALSVQSYVKYFLVFGQNVRIGVLDIALRDEPEGKVLGEYPAGSEFSLAGVRDGHILLKAANNIEGWAPADSAPPLWETAGK